MASASTVPFEDLADEVRRMVLYGSGDQEVMVTHRDASNRQRTYYTQYEGVIPTLERRFKETESDYSRWRIGMYMSVKPCPACGGCAPQAGEPCGHSRRAQHRRAMQTSQSSTPHRFLKDLKLDARQKAIAARLIKEVRPGCSSSSTWASTT